MSEPASICPPANSSDVIGDPNPRAIRWSTGYSESQFRETWTKWHYTDGNGSFTACGAPIVLGRGPSTFPEERDVERVNCRRCLAKMRSVLATPPDA